MQYLKKNRLYPSDYIEGVLSGDKVVLSKAITLIESQLASDQELTLQVLEGILPYSGSSKRVGITGVPGVGKSTFIESLGHYLSEYGSRIAVLAVDPSSKKTKGSILGDKTRMDWLSKQPNAFIRPSAAGLSLGGVAHHTRETIILCEAAGFDTILVETVGVGQSETVVHSMVDFFLLLMLSGAGDELQGIKKGIMEMADAVVITKADGENQKASKQAQVTYQNALHLLSSNENGWSPPVLTCSALENKGLESIWSKIEEHHNMMQQNGSWSVNRADQRLAWMHDCIRLEVHHAITRNPKLVDKLNQFENKVLDGSLLPGRAANEVMRDLFK